ncbi:MAG: transposase [Gammaproteobacteria bacterium]|nr:transposase [Gammaproteobacteria bacterium]
MSECPVTFLYRCTVLKRRQQHGPRVLYVADGRERGALDGYFRELGEAGCARIERVTMDRWPAYMASVKSHTDADVVYGKFHIVQH